MSESNYNDLLKMLDDHFLIKKRGFDNDELLLQGVIKTDQEEIKKALKAKPYEIKIDHIGEEYLIKAKYKK